MKKIYIYGLVDSIKNELKYIGKSVNPKNRYRKHLQESKKKLTYKDRWLNKLLENNQKPELLIIDVVNENNWVFWEKHYISYFKSIGCILTNISEGGDNPPNQIGKKRSKEIIEKIRNKNIGKKRSDDIKKKMSLSKKGKPIPHLNNEKNRSHLHKKNLSLSLKGRISPNKGKKYDDVHSKLLSNAHSHQKKSVIQMSLNGEIIKIWDSISEAKKEIKNSHIGECCSGKIKTAGGYKWKYNK